LYDTERCRRALTETSVGRQDDQATGGAPAGPSGGRATTTDRPLPAYAAPIPPGIPGPGWWKIRYVMSGNTSDNAYDLVTLKVSLRGSPVHLVTE
jgi:hypothetical protein